jgi:hypothetical protein
MAGKNFALLAGIRVLFTESHNRYFNCFSLIKMGEIIMKKIKSALEIALEKTKGMEPKEEGELNEIENQKYIKAALSLSRSYLENKIEKESLQEGFSNYPEKSRPAILEAFIEEALDKFSLENSLQVLEVITLLSSEERVLLACEKAKRIYEMYRHELNKKIAEIQEKVRDTLQKKYTAAGIGGSAIAGFNLNQPEQLWADVATEAERGYLHAQQDFFQVLRQDK